MITSVWDRLQGLVFASPAKRDKVFLVSLCLGLVLNICLIGMYLFLFSASAGFVALRYNIFFGISLFGRWYNFFWFSGAGLAVLVVNFLLAFHFYLKQRVLAYFLVGMAAVFNLSIFIVSIFLVYINL
ncbi:MAG TPA: hypothetical protein PK412_04040 [bacterium]|nr:hypothetical protein [bacterium]